MITHPDLLRLPIFTVSSIEVDGEDLVFEGTFSFFTDFYEANCDRVSYLYDPPLHYVGKIVRLDREHLTATFVAWADEHQQPKVGDSFCWLYGWDQPYYLNYFMDLDLWTPQKYSDPIAHDHCLICNVHICGKRDCPDYRDEVSYHCEELGQDGWVCNSCFNKYVAASSLAFVVPEHWD